MGQGIRVSTSGANYFSPMAVRILFPRKKGGIYLLWTGVRGMEGITSVFLFFWFLFVDARCARLDFPIQLDGLGIVSARHEKEQAVQPSYCSRASKPASQLMIRERQQCNFDFRYYLYVHIHGDVTGPVIRSPLQWGGPGGSRPPHPTPPNGISS